MTTRDACPVCGRVTCMKFGACRTLAYEKVAETLSLRASGWYTKRYHTIPFSIQQTIAEHSAQVLNLIIMLHPDPSIGLLKAVMYHDSAERYGGDVPGPAKRNHPTLKIACDNAEDAFMTKHPTADVIMQSISHVEKCWLKACDVLEAMLWCLDQAFIGNGHGTKLARRLYSWLESNNETPKEVMEFATEVMSREYRSFV